MGTRTLEPPGSGDKCMKQGRNTASLDGWDKGKQKQWAQGPLGWVEVKTEGKKKPVEEMNPVPSRSLIPMP